MTGLIINNEKSDYHNEIELLLKWSNDNNPILNVGKTKELSVDYRKCRNLKDSIIINGSAVKQVDIHKFLGLTVMNTLSCIQNTDKIITKGRQRLFFLHIKKIIQC